MSIPLKKKPAYKSSKSTSDWEYGMAVVAATPAVETVPKRPARKPTKRKPAKKTSLPNLDLVVESMTSTLDRALGSILGRLEALETKQASDNLNVKGLAEVLKAARPIVNSLIGGGNRLDDYSLITQAINTIDGFALGTGRIAIRISDGHPVIRTNAGIVDLTNGQFAWPQSAGLMPVAILPGGTTVSLSLAVED